MKEMNRRDLLWTAARAGVLAVTMAGTGAAGLLGLSGCGGGGEREVDNPTVQTGGTGLVSAVSLFPEPGATFISRDQDVELSWPDGNPPAAFTVTLHRFLEPRGGQARETPTQRIEVAPAGGNRWLVRRTDDFELDRGGVYYLEIASPGQNTERFAFIVDDDDRSETVGTGTGGDVEDVAITPRPGSAFLSRNQGFRLRWAAAAPPPSTFTAALHRYKEARGDESDSDDEQEITLTQRSEGGDYVWDLTRRDNFLLEPDATYYIRVESGPRTLRYAYLTES